MRRSLALCVVFYASAVLTAAADVAIIPCVRDNTLFEDSEGDTSSGAGPALFAGRNNQGRTRRALVAFDLVGAVPAEARIDSVVLTLCVSNAPDSTARGFSLHRALRDWGEGRSSSSGGAGAPATEGDATWLHAFYPLMLWAERGGDFDPAPGATQMCGAIGTCAWSGPGLAADVAVWVSNPADNHGWLLRGDEGGSQTVRRFDSREASMSVNRPTLTIHYSHLDPVASSRQTWGGLKAFYR
ncbi:MAG: DNRLRE domain-containing protein [Candidatus Eiseniibacteriota bacterium]